MSCSKSRTRYNFGYGAIYQRKTKSGKIRFININELLFEELQRLKNNEKQSPYVLYNPKTGKPFTTVKTAFKAACRRAGIKGLRLYDCRHTFASRLIEKGADIETVKSLLGHHSVTLTQRYTHSNNEMKMKEICYILSH